MCKSRPIKTEPGMLTTGQVAELLGISLTAVKKQIAAGKYPHHIRRPGSGGLLFLIPVSDLPRFAQNRRTRFFASEPGMLTRYQVAEMLGLTARAISLQVLKGWYPNVETRRCPGGIRYLIPLSDFMHRFHNSDVRDHHAPLHDGTAAILNVESSDLPGSKQAMAASDCTAMRVSERKAKSEAALLLIPKQERARELVAQIHALLEELENVCGE